MKKTADELNKVITGFFSELSIIDEAITGINLSEDKWSLKEIIGHLIDSASNNHQRFVRLKINDNLEFPDYNKDEWLNVQHHNKMPFKDLISLFLYFNKLISSIIENTDHNFLKNKWITKWDENTSYITLENLIIHYLEHLKGHIKHFNERLDEIKKIKRY
jgi:hypothetical protein